MARATDRSQETAVRRAIGASSARVIRLWLVESLALGAIAGILGVVLAGMFWRLAASALPADFPNLDDVTLGTGGIAAAIVLTLLVSALCGIAPAVLSTARERSSSLNEDDGSSQTVGFLRRPASRARAGIMVAQVAIACVLIVGGTLLTRSFAAMLRVDRGYEPVGLLSARLTFPHQEFASERRVQALEAIESRLSALPHVQDAGFGDSLPHLSTGNTIGRVIPSPKNPAEQLSISASWATVAPSYLSALRFRLKSGRILTDADTSASPAVMVVNEAFATAYLGAPPVGQRIRLRLASFAEWEVVGVVQNTVGNRVAEGARPEFFVSYRQAPSSLGFNPVLLTRVDGTPADFAGTLRQVVRSVDPGIVVDSVMEMDDRIMASLSTPRAYATVFGSLAFIALAIAGVGVLGVLSHATAQRTYEFGVRLAVGAAPNTIAGLVIRQALGPIVVGCVAGLVLTAFLASALSGFLYGVPVRDPISFAAGPISIALAALLACVIPVRRAAAIQPVRAMRGHRR